MRPDEINEIARAYKAAADEVERFNALEERVIMRYQRAEELLGSVRVPDDYASPLAVFAETDPVPDVIRRRH